MAQGQRPQYDVFVSREIEVGKNFYTKIGSAWNPDADRYGKSLMHLTLEGACLSAYLHSTETNSGSHQR
jgi:hypothetical protein